MPKKVVKKQTPEMKRMITSMRKQMNRSPKQLAKELAEGAKRRVKRLHQQEIGTRKTRICSKRSTHKYRLFSTIVTLVWKITHISAPLVVTFGRAHVDKLSTTVADKPLQKDTLDNVYLLYKRIVTHSTDVTNNT
ncbi:hypothetical protein EDC94DRAFT_586563 [Helicostylum pulchrum]|nr:hypothetical protein EDC94DRAFT_586563 [Helicostylum pulchrum]